MKSDKNYVFPPRNQSGTYSELLFNTHQKEYLEEIKEILESEGATWEIIIGPVYDQIFFTEENNRIQLEIISETHVHEFQRQNHWRWCVSLGFVELGYVWDFVC